MHVYKIDIDKCPDTGQIVLRQECPKCIYHKGFQMSQDVECVICDWFLDDNMK